MKLNRILTLFALAALFGFIAWGDKNLDRFLWQVLNFGAIYAIAAVGYTVINGITGQFSLGPHGFMLLGAYLVTLLILPLEQKKIVWLFQPLAWPFSEFFFSKAGFILALIVGGVLATSAAVSVETPAFRA